MTAAVATAPRTCPAWCVLHDPESDVCLGTNVTVEVTDDPTWQPFMAHALSVGLGLSSDGLSVGLAIDHVGPNEVPVEAARRYAEAILEQCRQAEASLIPGPRASTEGGAL